MTAADIPRLRLASQRLTSKSLTGASEVVRWLGAVQAQDFGAAKWALGLRVGDARDFEVENAFNTGEILRTHVMRPTWHFVLPEDIRWLLELTAPRVLRLNAPYFRKLELGPEILHRSSAVIEKALEAGADLTRDELKVQLTRAGIDAHGPLRMGYILMKAELDGIICSGPRDGKRFTYSLLDRRAPSPRNLDREHALAELTRRFFTSHGPATVRDMAKWSGLTVAEVKLGVESVRRTLQHESCGGLSYWTGPQQLASERRAHSALLLPNYDEYTVGYRDPSPVFDFANIANLKYPHFLAIDGIIKGTWRRTTTKSSVAIEIEPFDRLTESETESVDAAAARYVEFLGLHATIAA